MGHTSAGIMFPVTYPYPRVAHPEAHVTLFYFGEVEELAFTPLDILALTTGLNFDAYEHGLNIPIIGTDQFGPDHDISVLLVDDGRLRIEHAALALRLADYGIFSGSEFTEYRPHVTDPFTDNPPDYVTLHSPQLWWRDTRLRLQLPQD